jgi:hypothetical protein
MRAVQFLMAEGFSPDLECSFIIYDPDDDDSAVYSLDAYLELRSTRTWFLMVIPYLERQAEISFDIAVSVVCDYLFVAVASTSCAVAAVNYSGFRRVVVMSVMGLVAKLVQPSIKHVLRGQLCPYLGPLPSRSRRPIPRPARGFPRLILRLREIIAAGPLYF